MVLFSRISWETEHWKVDALLKGSVFNNWEIFTPNSYQERFLISLNLPIIQTITLYQYALHNVKCCEIIFIYYIFLLS